MRKGVLAALILATLFMTLAIHAAGTSALSTVQLRSMKEMVIEAPTKNVYFICISPHRMTRPEAAFDAVTSGTIYGMAKQEQYQGFDVNPNWIEQSDIPEWGVIPGRFKPYFKTVLLLGGPEASQVVAFYEKYKGITPVYYLGNHTEQYFVTNPDVTQESRLFKISNDDVNSGHKDLFVIESFKDSQGNTVFIVYGFTWRGTWAGGIYFKEQMYPTMIQDPSSYSQNYFIGRWVDTPDQYGYMDEVPQTAEITPY